MTADISRRQAVRRIGAIGLASAAGCLGRWRSNDGPTGWSRVSSLDDEYDGNHLHGIAYDHVEGRLYLGTHYGLFALVDEELYVVGDSRDDTMGLSIHPDDPAVLYRSGHPRTGGNLGVERSEDGGLTWDRIFAGVRDEVVDFHSMTISDADPDVLVGTYGSGLYVTEDGGRHWEIKGPTGLPPAGPAWGVPGLAASATDPAVLYASAYSELGDLVGVYVSADVGSTWTRVFEGLLTGITAHPSEASTLYGYRSDVGIVRSRDDGASWAPTPDTGGIGEEEFVFRFSVDRSDPDVVFAGTTGRTERILRSTDDGESWQQIL